MKLKINYIDNAHAELYHKPKRAHLFDAGLDCYAATCKSLKPNERAKIPLGFSLEIPHGNVILLTPRSSLNAKGIDVKLGTIDADYTGEISAIVENRTNEIFDITYDTKLCQLILVPIHHLDILETEYIKRSKNGFGSTDK